MRYLIIALFLSACGEQRILDTGKYQVTAKKWDLICTQTDDVSELYQSKAWVVSLPNPDGYWLLTIGSLFLKGEESANDVEFSEIWTAYDPDRLDSHAVIHAAMDEDKLIATLQVWQTPQQNTREPVPACVNMWDITGKP